MWLCTQMKYAAAHQRGYVATCIFKVPLICIKGKEDVNMPNLGYELLKKEDIFSFYSMSYSYAVNSNEEKNCKKIKEFMTRRIHAQCRTLIDNNVRHVVFSAFGCSREGQVRKWPITTCGVEQTKERSDLRCDGSS